MTKSGVRVMAAVLAALLLFSYIHVFAEPSTQVDTNVSTQLVKAKSGI